MAARRQHGTAGRTGARGELRSRPVQVEGNIGLGLQPVGPGGEADGLLYIPRSYSPKTRSPLVLMLHGAGGDARNGLVPLMPLADEAGLILLAAGAREETWDVIIHDYGPDVAVIDALLGETFATCMVDPAHIAVEGFSDGASYALSLGLSNGDLFTHIIAFSPGFLRPARQVDTPKIFISHGVRDTVLPIGNCSRRIVPALKEAGYDVTYDEFDDGHTVPRGVAEAAVRWFEGSP
jgi:predicted esterase